jgi:hypothetical protein
MGRGRSAIGSGKAWETGKTVNYMARIDAATIKMTTIVDIIAGGLKRDE